MKYDVFLSHSSEDSALVERARRELEALGYRVFLDTEALPAVRPEQVSRETAQALREAMRECASLLYLISSNSGSSRWMPWELGFFDGSCGRVFVLPMDDGAEAKARGREYLKIYPLVPLQGRRDYLLKHLPKAAAQLPGAGAAAWPMPQAPLVPMFDFAHEEATEGYRRRLAQDWPGSAFDPTRAWQLGSEIMQAWWRLWGLAPPPRRPGEDGGRWQD